MCDEKEKTKEHKGEHGQNKRADIVVSAHVLSPNHFQLPVFLGRILCLGFVKEDKLEERRYRRRKQKTNKRRVRQQSMGESDDGGRM